MTSDRMKSQQSCEVNTFKPHTWKYAPFKQPTTFRKQITVTFFFTNKDTTTR